MTVFDAQKITSQAEAHTKIKVMQAIFKAYYLVELLTLFNLLLAIVAIVFAPNVLVKILASLVLLAGAGVFYFALRIRIDQALFADWHTLDIPALDAALKDLNPHHQAGKTLSSRLTGGYQLFQRGVFFLIVQFGLLIVLAWFFVPKNLN